ncbi:MAG: PadR family transcriptional regulator [Thermotogota bacterium]
MTKLMLLGLLKQRDLSGYEIKQLLESTDAENWSGIQIGSIYYALKKMEKEQLIIQKKIVQTGNRFKTIFSITEKGKETFNQKLLKKIEQTKVSFPSELYTTLTFIGELDREIAISALDKNIQHYEKALSSWKNDRVLKKEAQGEPLSPFLEILFQNGEKHIEADIAYLKQAKELLKNESFKITIPERV